MSAGASGRGGPLVWLLAAGLAAAVAITYANALGNDFVYDDFLLIVDNPRLHEPFSEGGWSGLGYRPLRLLSYRLDYALGGMDPWAFHLSNVVYHAVTVLLVAAALAALGISPWAAAAGALVFAVHPVQTDAVSYVSGRRDVLCGLFFVAGFLAYLRHRARGSFGPLVLAGAAWCLAFLSKEMAVTLPLVCMLADRSQRRRERLGLAPPWPAPAPWLRAAAVAAVVGLVVAVILLATSYAGFLRRVASGTPWHGGGIGSNFATVARVWLHYLTLVLWPARLAADYGAGGFPVSTEALDPRALAAAAVLAAVALAGWLAWRRGALSGLGLAWIAVTLLPVSHLVPYVELLAEHYLYIPMVGVALVVADGVERAAARAPARRAVVGAVVLAAVAALMARSIVRNRDWKDGLTLWTANVATLPGAARARFNLGDMYQRQGRVAEAERVWREAAELHPQSFHYPLALAKLAYRSGDYPPAYRDVKRALRLRPEDPEALTLAGWISLHAGETRRARAFFDAALARLPLHEAGEAVVGRTRAQAALAAAADPAAAERSR